MFVSRKAGILFISLSFWSIGFAMWRAYKIESALGTGKWIYLDSAKKPDLVAWSRLINNLIQVMFPFCVDDREEGPLQTTHPWPHPFTSCLGSCRPNQLEWAITQNEGTQHQWLHNELWRLQTPNCGSLRTTPISVAWVYKKNAGS